MADLFGIGLSGLKASQTHLAVTGQNITNVNTPGYSRQTALQSARDPSFSGVGYIGNGVSIDDVQRIQNQFLTNQVRASTSINSEVTTFQSQIEELNGLLAGSATGINPAMQSFFNALQTAVEDPASLPARQLFLSEADGLASKFNNIHERLTAQNEFIGQQIGTVADQATRLASNIASYNDSIAKAAATGSQPNDLLDQRDEAIRQLSQYVAVTVVKQDDNALNIFIGSGQPLVVGNQASELTTSPGKADPNRIEVKLVSGQSEQDITGLISGGEMGGLLRYRDELDNALNSVGRMALSISSEVNSQLGLGLDLNGNVGSRLFANINTDDAMAARSQPMDDSSGTLNVRITDTKFLSTSDYELTVTDDPTQYRLRNLSDNTLSGPFDFGPSVNELGFNVENVGSVTVGHRYLITPTRLGAQSIEAVMKTPQELAFAAPVSGEASLDNRGTAKINQPTLVSGPQPIELNVMNGFLPITMTYDDSDPANPKLILANSKVPAVPPEDIAVSPGQTNTLEWDIDGYTFRMEIMGRPLNGDSFKISFNEGVSDNRNALKLSELQTAPVLEKAPGKPSSGFSFADGYGNLIQHVGTLTAQTRTEAEATGAVLRQATSNRDSVSAVNLDEEAANLIRFEQYYNASAQVIQIARSTFDTLINSIR